MTDTNHTPGPWFLVEEDGDLHIKSADGESLMCDMDYYPWAPTNKKDWDLIAAAPDLLEALEQSTKEWIELAESGDCGNWNVDQMSVVTNARAAIAKAKGQTS